MKKYGCILLAVLLLLACQPTPEHEVITNRLDGDLEETIVSLPAEEYTYEVPERWEEEMEVRDVKIHIDAPIEMSGATEHPVITIARDSFTKQSTLDLLHKILGDDLEIRDTDFGYDEAMYNLKVVVRGWFQEVGDDGELIFSAYEGQQEDIDRWQKMLAELPTEDIYSPLTSSNWRFPLEDTLVRIRNADGEYRYVQCTQDYINIFRDYGGDVQRESWVQAGDAFPGERPHSLENVKITEEEAIAMGDAFMASLDRSDMKVTRIDRARELDDFNEVKTEGYYLQYTSSLDGSIPCSPIGYTDCQFLGFTAKTVSDLERYGRSWMMEYANLFVNEDGVISVIWREPKEIIGTANENAVLLPFNEVQQHIRDYFEYGINDLKLVEDVYLTKIVLGTAIQQIPDQGDEAFLVPTWYLYFETDKTLRAVALSKPLLLISALDGTYVDRLYG